MLTAALTIPLVASATGQSLTLSFCANKKSGAMRYAGKCTASERRVTWSAFSPGRRARRVIKAGPVPQAHEGFRANPAHRENLACKVNQVCKPGAAGETWPQGQRGAAGATVGATLNFTGFREDLLNGPAVTGLTPGVRYIMSWNATVEMYYQYGDSSTYATAVCRPAVVDDISQDMRVVDFSLLKSTRLTENVVSGMAFFEATEADMHLSVTCDRTPTRLVDMGASLFALDEPAAA